MAFLETYKIAVLVAVLLFGFWAGNALKQAAWDRADNTALELQAELDEQSDAERKVLNELNLQLQLDLEQAERNTERMANEIQDAINRASVVTTFTPKAPQNCPVVRCNVVDAAQHYRLFNAAISNTIEAVPDAGKTRLGDARLPGSVSVTGVDGSSRPYYEDGSL